MVFDSLHILAACALFAASVGAWWLAAPLRASARLYLRFAAMLFAALGAAGLVGLADVAALFLLPLSAASLMVAALARFASPLPVFAASLALSAGLACGFGALLSGITMLALAPVMLAGFAVMATALKDVAFIPVLAGASLLGSSLVFLEQGAREGLFLFCAAALIGLAKPPASSALAVQQ